MAESKSASVVFTDSSLLAKKAQASAASAQKTADGKNSVYIGADPSTVPTSGLKEGDIYFSDNAIYIWTGSAWGKTAADISAKVDEARKESQRSVSDLKTSVEAKVKALDDKIAQLNDCILDLQTKVKDGTDGKTED